jgi:quercetin dioxygenase-like cupin family protein
LVTKTTVLFSLLAASAAYAVETVKVGIDNDQVRVVQVVVQPHEKTKLHQHKVNRVMIYLNSGRQDFDYQPGGKSVLNVKAGEVKWSPAGGMHIAEVTSAHPIGIVEIELKKPGSGKSASAARDPLKVDAKQYKLEFENDQVRVFRVKIGPHESTPLHEHAVNRVVTYITDQTFRITSSDGKVDMPVHKAGDVSWGTPVQHTEENLSDKPFEAVVTEFK